MSPAPASPETRHEPRSGEREARLATVLEPTLGAPHVRQERSVRDLYGAFLVALVPCVAIGAHRLGLAALAGEAAAGSVTTGWNDPGNATACGLRGLWILLPPFLVALAVCAGWEALFARLRGRARLPGTLLTATLFALLLPPGLPPLQLALGVSFGVVFGREVFGGIGMQLVHPVALGWVFVARAWPAALGPAEAWSLGPGPTALELALAGDPALLARHELSWMRAFLGLTPGRAAGAVPLGCLLGALWLLHARVVSGRVLAGTALGVALAAWALEARPGATDLAPHWHAVLGTAAFGAVFLAGDPSGSAATRAGRWLQGLTLGFVLVALRLRSPVPVEGTCAALLLAGVLVPLFDHTVVALHVRGRARRIGPGGSAP